MITNMSTAIKEKILSVNSAAPRYTSYPPATAFQAGFAPESYQKWLAALPETPVSLYCHIPFCRRLCYYCGCHTTICNDDARLPPYVGALKAEMDLACAYAGAGRAVSHIHFGGGSPTILSPAQFSELMTHMRQRFAVAANADIAIEADPRQFSEALMATYARHGVTRISLGAQDFDQRVLEAVNRPQPFSLSWNAVALCREYGIGSVNIDLMYGLPGQTLESITRTMEMALTLKPDRIAFFGYAHVPWMKKHMKMMGNMVLPDASLRYDLYEAGRQILLDNGYLAVGIDHFVRPTDSMARAMGNRLLRRNFQGYTTDEADTLIGFGASAIGTFPQGFAQNIADLRLYQDRVAEGGLPVHRGYMRKVEDDIYAAIISEIMCYLAVDLADIALRHQFDPCRFDTALERLRPLQEGGLVTRHDKFLRVHHPHVARVAAACFDPAINLETLVARHSSVV